VNFLHVSTFYPPYSFGGDATYLHRLCHILGDLGHQVDVVHCVDSYHLLHPGQPEIEFPEHPSVTRHELRSGLGWLSPLLSQQTGRPWLKGQIRRLMQSRKYDVVHFHNTSLLGPHVLTMGLRGANAVKMYTTHEHWLVCPMHVLWKYTERPCDKPACLRCTLRGHRPPQLWRYTNLLGRCARHVDQFVSPSRFTAQMHAERGFGPRVDHLPYFIDRTDQDWTAPSQSPHQRPYFLFVGRLEKIKGLQTVIPLWRQVPGADLLVAGTGSYERPLRDMAADNPRIKFLGPQSQRALGPLYYHALACIIPSITYETFGMISIEAFARKTPAIVRDLGALPEVVQESGGGLVYRTDDELLQAIRQIADSPPLRSQLGENGYRAFVEKWCGDAHVRLYFGFLETIAERKFGSVPWKETPRDTPPRAGHALAKVH
jgi:glycosyltransferase involved in cell wall biosynthesis